MKEFLKKKNIEISLKRYGIDALGAMAQGLFCSLLIGTIINTFGAQLHIGFLTETVATVGGVNYTVGGIASAMSGPAMAIAIGYALKCPPLVLFSMTAVGFAANALGGAGGPLAVLFIAIIAAEFGKVVSKETKVDILVTPLVTIGVGMFLSWLIAPPLGKAATGLRDRRRCPDASHFLRRDLRGAPADRPGRRRRCGGLLCPDDRLRRHLLPGKQSGRPDLPGARNLHATDGQHRKESPRLDRADACVRHYRSRRDLRLPDGDERHPDFLRDGYMRPGRPPGRLHRLAE